MDAITEATLMGKSPDPVVTTPAAATPAAQPISGATASPTDGNAASAAPVDGQTATVKPGDPAKQPLPSTPEQIAADAKKAEDDLKNALVLQRTRNKERHDLSGNTQPARKSHVV